MDVVFVELFAKVFVHISRVNDEFDLRMLPVGVERDVVQTRAGHDAD